VFTTLEKVSNSNEDNKGKKWKIGKHLNVYAISSNAQCFYVLSKFSFKNIIYTKFFYFQHGPKHTINSSKEKTKLDQSNM
jgi:hypothetical protein